MSGMYLSIENTKLRIMIDRVPGRFWRPMYRKFYWGIWVFCFDHRVSIRWDGIKKWN